VQAPTLVVVADGDEYMAEADAVLAWLEPTEVIRLEGKGHYDVLEDATVQREASGFLAK
jgi:hypothetical protein